MTNPYKHVFYCIYEDDEEVGGDAPISKTQAEVESLIRRVVNGVDNYIGFVDDEGDTIQVMCEARDHIWIEVPVESEAGSYGKLMVEKDVIGFLLSMNPPFKKYIDILSLSFKPWSGDHILEE